MVTDEDLRLRRRIGDNVRRLRQEANLSAKEAAKRAGMGLRTLQRVEAAEANLRLEKLVDLCIGLGVDVTEMLQSPPSTPPPS